MNSTNPYFVQFPDLGLVLNLAQVQRIDYDLGKREAVCYQAFGLKTYLSGENFEFLIDSLRQLPGQQQVAIELTEDPVDTW